MQMIDNWKSVFFIHFSFSGVGFLQKIPGDNQSIIFIGIHFYLVLICSLDYGSKSKQFAVFFPYLYLMSDIISV